MSGSFARAVCVIVAAALVLAATAGEASAAPKRGGWRSTRYGRRGTEIWLEYPRFTNAWGDAYRWDERNISTGIGFGFGLMWGLSDNIALEGRMVQSNHTTGPEDDQWDMDHIHVGPRYTFFTESRFQPFVGAGWAKLTLERDAGHESDLEFYRLNGYAWYATTGVDYIHSSAWSAFLRIDYTHGGYGHESVGLDETKLEDPLSSRSMAASMGVAYRIPAW